MALSMMVSPSELEASWGLIKVLFVLPGLEVFGVRYTTSWGRPALVEKTLKAFR